MSKKKDVNISLITVEIGEAEIALTIDQARELRTALDEVLGKEVVERIIERPYYPYTWQPYTIAYSNTDKTDKTE